MKRSKILDKIKNRLSRSLRSLIKLRSLPVISPQKGYELWAATYSENMNPVQILESKALEELLPPLEGCFVLDLGCGKGRISRLALERGARKTVGLDSSQSMLRAASAAIHSASAHWVRGNAEVLPFKKGEFDVVICALMMGHVPEPATVLSQIHNVLRPGGFLLISDFHPFETMRGSVRSFRDVNQNRTYAIRQYTHLIEYYMRSFNKLGFILEDLREPLYKDFPLVFVLRARKI